MKDADLLTTLAFEIGRVECYTVFDIHQYLTRLSEISISGTCFSELQTNESRST